MSVVKTVKAAARALEFTDPILVVAAPNAADYLGALGERLSVYYCIDDFTQWPGALTRQIAAWEETLLRRCDVVMATAQNLREKKTRGGRVPLYLSHGVDVEHFAECEGPVPGAIAALPKPVIGFFGAISPWVDLDLIAGIAQSRPSWSIVLIGPADVDVERLRALPNVHLLGKVPYSDLPRFAGGFDVGLIPFVINELTVSVNPLKLLEYFACGLPVVSADMPEVRRFRRPSRSRATQRVFWRPSRRAWRPTLPSDASSGSISQGIHPGRLSPTVSAATSRPRRLVGRSRPDPGPAPRRQAKCE